jgi:DNA-nicking Smr family endonuclease
MSARSGRHRVLSLEERGLWRKVTQSIAPLHDRLDSDPGKEATESTIPPRREAREKRTAKAVPVAAPPPGAPKITLTPLGRRMRQRVARGREAIDARLDLHGMTQSEAHAALLHFVRAASARGSRLVLVITGKGRRNTGETGVLRRQVPHWLALPEFRSMVIGFEDAHITHGGEGALYVRLRRPRDR